MVFMRILFHKSGKPRGIFRELILMKGGLPHEPFRVWMTGPDYQKLPLAVRFDKLKEDAMNLKTVSAD
jgi:hypothetical protein